MVKDNVTHYQVSGQRKNQRNKRTHGGFKQSKRKKKQNSQITGKECY